MSVGEKHFLINHPEVIRTVILKHCGELMKSKAQNSSFVSFKDCTKIWNITIEINKLGWVSVLVSRIALGQYGIWLPAGRPGDRGSIPSRGERIFPVACVQNGSWDHPASCPVGTRGPFPGAKARSGRDSDHSHPSSTEVENEQELYLLSTQAPSVAWDSFSF
jgi:hypothetical protein